MEGDTTRRALC